MLRYGCFVKRKIASSTTLAINKNAFRQGMESILLSTYDENNKRLLRLLVVHALK